MVKITGTLHIKTGFVRLKPNINFIGATLGVSVYDLSRSLKIELNPTPAEGLYLVDYTFDINSHFLPTEHWIIPNEDCTFDEIRGIKKLTSNLTKALEDQILILESENISLRNLQDATTKEQQEYSAYTHELKNQLDTLKQEQELQSAYTKNLEFRLENLVSENSKLTIDTDYVQNLETQLFNLQKDYEINLTKLNNIKLLQEQIETLTTENSRLSQSAIALEDQMLILESENISLRNLQDTTTKEQQEYSAYTHELKNQLDTLKQEQELQSAYTKNLEVRLENLVSENRTLLNSSKEMRLSSVITIEELQDQIKALTLENSKLTIDTDYVQNLETQLFNLQKDYEINLTKLNNIKLLQEQIETLTTENSRLSQSAVEEEGLDAKVNSSLDILKRFS